MAKYAEGTVSPSGKHVVQGGKWVPITTAAPAVQDVVKKGVDKATGPPPMWQRALPYALKALDYASIPFQPLTAAVNTAVREPLRKVPALAAEMDVPLESTAPEAFGGRVSGESLKAPALADTIATSLEMGLATPFAKLLGSAPGHLRRALPVIAKDVQSLPSLLIKRPPMPTVTSWGEEVSPLFSGPTVHPLSTKQLLDIPPAMRKGQPLQDFPAVETPELAQVAATTEAAGPGRFTKMMDLAKSAMPRTVFGGRKLTEPLAPEPLKPINYEEAKPAMDAAFAQLDRGGIGLTAPEVQTGPLMEPALAVGPHSILKTPAEAGTGPFSFLSSGPGKQAEQLWQRGVKGRVPPGRKPSEWEGMRKNWDEDEVWGVIRLLQSIGQLGR